MVASLWDMAVSLLGSVAVAASSIVVPIPQSTNFFAQTSGTIVSQQFSTDPRTGAVAASQSQGANLEAFIYHDGQCPYVGEELYYRVYVGNSGDSPARNLVIQFQYPPGTSFVSADPGADTLDEPRRIVLWRLGTLAPLHGYAEYSVAVRATATGAKSSSLVVTYVDGRGQTQVALTSHTIPDGCGETGSDSKPRPAGKSPAIICDPAETSCTGFLPELGKRFGLAQPAVQDLVLGVRFEEAVADILPGECSVVADDIISTPDYHDAFNRLYDPAAFYLDPLYQSGQDFKQLVHENSLLGIAFTVKAKARLLKLHGQIWQEHVDILNQVTSGKISGAGGRERINRLIDRYRQGLQGEQQQISREYIAMQNKRRAKFDPVAKKAIANAKTSIQRACNESSDGGLSNLLPPVRTAYIQALNTRSSEFPRTQGQYAGLAPVVSIWQQRLFPALTAWDQNNEKLLKNYLLGQGGYSNSSFESLFDAYNRHQATDFSVFEVVRLEEFEVALDTPKTKATECEKKKKFKQPVESSYCESREYSQQILGVEANQIKNTRPNAKPFEAIPPGQSTIDASQVKGQACSGLPGDPWWASGCECKCNDLVATGAFDGNGNPIFSTCQAVFEIVRHDVAVTSQDECLAQKGHHRELYF